jgi:hypothetical protein
MFYIIKGFIKWQNFKDKATRWLGVGGIIVVAIAAFVYMLL